MRLDSKLCLRGSSIAGAFFQCLMTACCLMGKRDGGRQAGAVTLNSIGCEEERLADKEFQLSELVIGWNGVSPKNLPF